MLKKITGIFISVVFTLLLLSSCGMSTESVLESAPKSFSSEAQIKQVIDSFNSNNYNGSRSDMIAEFALDDAAPKSAGSDDYSKTNTQVEGIDEGDIVKVDNGYIYKLQASGLIIVKAEGEELTKVAEIVIENYVPQEIYISGDKLILIGGIYKTFNYYGNSRIEPMCDIFFGYNDTDIRIYNITDREKPVLQRQMTLSGYYFTSRLIENKFYFITNYYFYYNDEKSYIPKISDSTIDGGVSKNIPLENIYYYESVPSYAYMLLGFIDLNVPTESDLKAYLGLSGEIYVSENHIYVATADYSGIYKRNLFGAYETAKNSFAKTRIVKLALSDLKQKAISRVDGTIKDRYSLDEYEGNLRVATTVNIWNWVSFDNNSDVKSNDTATTEPDRTVNQNIYNNIFVLDSELKLLGKVEKIAYGETIYSVRFNKTTGSLVTFELIDPYFKLDLSDPANPKVSQGLKESGVSHYLHYIGDSGLTIGVGRESETINTQWGEQVVWKGLKVSLYDNNGEEAVNVSTPNLGDYDYVYAELFYNPKALLYDEEKSLFAFPVQMWNYKNSLYYYQPDNMKQGVAVFSFDIEKKELEYRGLLSNFNTDVNLESWNDYYNNYWSFISRCVRIGDYLYTISERYITSYDFDTLIQGKKLEVATESNIYRLY